MGFLLAVGLEVRGQELVFCAIDISVLPAAFDNLGRPVADVLPVHLFQRVEEISGLAEGHKPVSPRLPSPAVPHHSRHVEGRVFHPESISQNLVGGLVTQVAYKYSIVLLGPLLHCFVLPHYAGCLPKDMALILVLLLLLVLLFDLLSLLGIQL